MKLLHTSDWHLGKVVFGYSLLEEQKHFLENLGDHLESGSYDLLVIAGDLYDRSIPPVEAVELLDGFLVRLRARCPNLPVLIIPGNHDSAERLSFGASLFSKQGIHLVCSREQMMVPLEFHAGGVNVQVWGMPYLYAGEITGSAQSTHVEEVVAAVTAIRERQKPEAVQVLAAHLFVLGGEGSESERILVGDSTQIRPAELAGFDYVALGHLHKPQSAGLGIHYSGSPLCYSFSEVAYDKGMLAVTLKPGAKPEVVQVRLPSLRKWSRVSAAYEELLRPEQHPALAAVRQDCLEITLTDEQLIPNAVMTLQNLYPGLLNLRQNPKLLATTAGGEPASAVASENLGPMDFFRTFHARVFDAPPAEELEREVLRVIEVVSRDPR